MQHPALAFATRSAVRRVLRALDVVGVPDAQAAVQHAVQIAAGVLVLVLARVGIVAQVAVAVLGHKILALVRDVEILAVELVLAVVELAPDVQVLIPYIMHIDFSGGKMIKIEISKELSDYIESLQFEVERTKEIVAFMLSNPGYDTHTNTFAQWEKDNQEAYAKLCLAKNNLEHEVIPKLLPKGTGAVKTWSLDFYTHEVMVEVADAQEN